MKRTLTVCIIVAIVIIAIFVIAINTKENKKEGFNITTSFYPMYIATLNITDGANNVNLKNLTKETTGCLHDYTLSPEEIIAMADSDVLIINGAGMEGFLDKVISNYPNLHVIDGSKNIELIISESGETEYNPHIFASVTKYMAEVKNISEELIKLNPENALVYEKNTEEYIVKLENLKADIDEAMKSITNRGIITFHEAFAYFADEFNLNVVATIEREPGTEPNAGELADTINIIKEKNVSAIFVEPGYSMKIASTIANETNAKVYTLDPVASGAFEKDAYQKIMQKNIETLKQALQ